MQVSVLICLVYVRVEVVQLQLDTRYHNLLALSPDLSAPTLLPLSSLLYKSDPADQQPYIKHYQTQVLSPLFKKTSRAYVHHRSVSVSWRIYAAQDSVILRRPHRH